MAHEGARPFLVSARFDLGWFVLPGALAALAGLAIGVLDPSPRPAGPALWIVGVLLVDVAHVWASLYRTYLDRDARHHHRRALTLTPLVCGLVGFALHRLSPTAFWSVLAYVAIFHFIKQHLGFALLYARAGRESPRDRSLARAIVWASTAGPVVWWHANLPRRFVWFMEGDLLAGLPGWVGTVALLPQLPLWAWFLVRRLRHRGPANPMFVALVALPAVTWHLGIVWFDDDRIFTLTNVFTHGVPYLALVWLAGGRAWVASRLRATDRGLVMVLAVYYGAIAALAFSEELLWDRFVWHERPELFGASEGALAPLWGSLVVALLTVPQATHYVLDRWIWRVGPKNPRLADQLGLR